MVAKAALLAMENIIVSQNVNKKQKGLKVKLKKFLVSHWCLHFKIAAALTFFYDLKYRKCMEKMCVFVDLLCQLTITDKTDSFAWFQCCKKAKESACHIYIIKKL